MPAATTPFAPSSPTFPLPRLAALATRAPLGGPREILMGALAVARLGCGCCAPHPLPLETRVARAAGVRTWLTALAVPTKTRAVLQAAIAASAGERPAAMADAVLAVTDITAAHLDRTARSELEGVVSRLRAADAALAAVLPQPIE